MPYSEAVLTQMHNDNVMFLELDTSLNTENCGFQQHTALETLSDDE